ncbi:VWA domain-containing protein [Pseudomonadota bacterium]
MTDKKQSIVTRSSDKDVAEFLKQAASTPLVKSEGKRGRLIFALDATASRGPSWDQACQLQGEMFKETEKLGGLEIQLVYYRGYGEFVSCPWSTRSKDLLSNMQKAYCVGGTTQIEKVLRHTIRQNLEREVNALVFVGDCIEENIDPLSNLAGQMGIHSIPAFMFQEGFEPIAQQAFMQISRLSGGAYCHFDAGSAQQLRDLLGAVAVYAAGGRKALERLGDTRKGVALQLTQQIKGR